MFQGNIVTEPYTELVIFMRSAMTQDELDAVPVAGLGGWPAGPVNAADVGWWTNWRDSK